MAKSMLSAQERKLLSETRDILEELLETEEVLRDKALTKSIRNSQEDVKAGRLYTVEELKSKLRREGKPVASHRREARVDTLTKPLAGQLP